jgi:hypothetical protein
MIRSKIQFRILRLGILTATGWDYVINLGLGEKKVWDSVGEDREFGEGKRGEDEIEKGN